MRTKLTQAPDIPAPPAVPSPLPWDFEVLRVFYEAGRADALAGAAAGP